MRDGGYALGGEQSGHVIDLEFGTTGDGLLTSVLLLSIAAREKRRLHELVGDLRVFPQVLLSVRGATKDLIESSAAVREAISRAQRELGSDGRVLVRPSGTEPVIRVMVEGEDRGATDRIAHELAALIERAPYACSIRSA